MPDSYDNISTNSSHLAAVIVSIVTLMVAGCLLTTHETVARKSAHSSKKADTQTIVLFVVSLSCSHCYEQIELFAEEFTDVPIIVVSPQIDSDIRKRVERDGIQFVRDANNTWSQRLDIPHMGGMHATVILARDGKTAWKHVAPEPLIDVTIVRRQLGR